MAANDIVHEFKMGEIRILVYETSTGHFVSADQAGWTDGVWDTAEEALEATKVLNGITTEEINK